MKFSLVEFSIRHLKLVLWAAAASRPLASWNTIPPLASASNTPSMTMQ